MVSQRPPESHNGILQRCKQLSIRAPAGRSNARSLALLGNICLENICRITPFFQIYFLPFWYTKSGSTEQISNENHGQWKSFSMAVIFITKSFAIFGKKNISTRNKWLQPRKCTQEKFFRLFFVDTFRSVSYLETYSPTGILQVAIAGTKQSWHVRIELLKP